MDTQGLSFAYLYIVGGIFFLIGLVIAIKSKQLNLSTREGKRDLTILVVGFALYFAGHYLVTYILPFT